MTAREDQAGIRTPREMAMGKPERNYSAITPKVGAQGAAPQHFESDLARCKNCGKVDNMHRPDGTCVAQPPQNALTADQYWESDPMWSKWPEHVTPEMVSQIRALMCLFAESYCALRARSTPSPDPGRFLLRNKTFKPQSYCGHQEEEVGKAELY